MKQADEKHSCWQGLAIVLRDGLEGYPPPTTPEPNQKINYNYPVKRKTARRVLREWGEVA